MASDERLVTKYAQLGSFVTYSAPRVWSTQIVYQSSRARQWVRNFKTRRAALVSLLEHGYLPTSYYVDDLQENVNSKPISFSGQLSSDPRATYAWSIIPATPRHPVSAGTDTYLAKRVLAVQESLQSKISGNGTNLAVSASEARETVGMIGDAAKKLFTAYRHVRHGNFRAGALALGLQKTPKRVSRRESAGDNWLQYRYGWRLVVQDMVSLMETLHDCLTTRPPILRVTALSATDSYLAWDLGTKSLSLPNGNSLCTYNETKRTQFLMEARGGYVYQLECVGLATGQSFGLINPFTFAWEVIPYSFVLDWVVNVGSILEGLTAFQGKKQLDGWMSKSIESITTYQWSNLTKSSGVFSMVDSKERLFGPVRERRFVRGYMAFTPSQIRLDLDLNVKKVVDIACMLKQQVLR